MPIKPVDYSQTHFYKIVCKDLSIKDCYVGHTTNFKNRKNAHETSHYNSNGKTYNGRINNKYLYRFINDNGGWENWDMVLIATLNCENSLDAKKKEREYIETLNATLNESRPYINKQEKADYKKQWTKDNAERVKEKKKQWYLENKEHCNQKSKTGYEQNKEEWNKRGREYYAQNKDYLKQKMKEKYYSRQKQD